MSRIFLSPPHMSGNELELIREAFDTNWIAPLGPQVDAFEEEFSEKVGVPYAAALSSGTAALHLALQMFGCLSWRRGVVPNADIRSLGLRNHLPRRAPGLRRL